MCAKLLMRVGASMAAKSRFTLTNYCYCLAAKGCVGTACPSNLVKFSSRDGSWCAMKLGHMLDDVYSCGAVNGGCRGAHSGSNHGFVVALLLWFKLRNEEEDVAFSFRLVGFIKVTTFSGTRTLEDFNSLKKNFLTLFFKKSISLSLQNIQRLMQESRILAWYFWCEKVGNLGFRWGSMLFETF